VAQQGTETGEGSGVHWLAGVCRASRGTFVEGPTSAQATSAAQTITFGPCLQQSRVLW
jgi:hypothetical protein